MTIKEWIKKDEVMDIIKGLPQDLWEEYIFMLKGVWCDEEAHGLADEAKRVAIEAPQQEPVKHGKWIEGELYIKCSECGYPVGHLSDNFCPNCGAKMDKEGESENK